MRGLLVLTILMATAAAAHAQRPARPSNPRQGQTPPATPRVQTPQAQPSRPPVPQPQVARACTVTIDSTGREMVGNKLPTGQYQVFAGGGVFGHCQNDPQTQMDSDSFAWYPDRNQLDLIGSVHFRDTTFTLTADRVTYWTRQERLYAEGRVYTQNLRSRSNLRGPNLDYRRARPGVRDTVEMYATARPTIRFYSSRDTARTATAAGAPATADSAEPFVIVADRSRMKGNDQMWGGGNVTVDRSDLAARGDSAMLDLAADRGLLLGGHGIDPVVTGKGDKEYRLAGVRLAFSLSEKHDLRRVLASGEADARGPDWHLRADTMDFTLDSGKIERTLAWGRTRRPDAVSSTYTIVADSLDILMPAQVIRDVWAFRGARATTRSDSTVAEDDWMMGDTLHAVFLPPDTGRADSLAARDSGAVRDSGATRKQRLERLHSFGHARALYHVTDDAKPTERPGVNYNRGSRIAIRMRDGKVHTVDVVGLVDGVYLEPFTRRTDADSTGVPGDTTRAPAGARPPGDSTAVRRSAPPGDTSAIRRPPPPLPRTLP